MNKLDDSILTNQYQLYGLVTLRVLIGWHFLYEGISKVINPYCHLPLICLIQNGFFLVLQMLLFPIRPY